MTQVVKSLLLIIREILIGFLASSFSVAQAWPLQAFEEGTSG